MTGPSKPTQIWVEIAIIIAKFVQCSKFSPLAPLFGSSLPYWSTGLITQFLDLSQAVVLLGRVISSSEDPYLNTERRGHTLHIHAQGGIRTRNHGLRAIEDCSCLRPLGYRDRHNIVSWGRLISSKVRIHEAYEVFEPLNPFDFLTWNIMQTPEFLSGCCHHWTINHHMDIVAASLSSRGRFSLLYEFCFSVLLWNAIQ
jgi:hypothetical protein